MLQISPWSKEGATRNWIWSIGCQTFPVFLWPSFSSCEPGIALPSEDVVAVNKCGLEEWPLLHPCLSLSPPVVVAWGMAIQSACQEKRLLGNYQNVSTKSGNRTRWHRELQSKHFSEEKKNILNSWYVQERPVIHSEPEAEGAFNRH